MEVFFRFLGATHLIYALLLFGVLANALDEKSGIDLPRAQWGIKTLLLLAEIAFLCICGVAALLLEPSAFIYAFLAILMAFLLAFSDTVALRGPSALADLPTAFYLHSLIRGFAALALFALGRSVGSA